MSPNDLGPEHSGAAQTDWQFAYILNGITKAAAHAAPLSAAAFGGDAHGPAALHVLPVDFLGMDASNHPNALVHLA
jgi:hypothetical protein